MTLQRALKLSLLVALTLGAPQGQNQDQDVEPPPAPIPSQWAGPARTTRPWGEPMNNHQRRQPTPNSLSWGGPDMNTRPWRATAMNNDQWGRPAMNTWPWGRSLGNTQPWRQPYMAQAETVQQNFPEYAGSASVTPQGNIEILPAYPNQQGAHMTYQPPQPYQQSQRHQPSEPYQPYPSYPALQNPGWSRSYSPLPGNGNCFNKCSNRCGSYNTYSGCRPTCSSRCNILPSCSSSTSSDYMFAGNTLYCGNRQQPQPQWINQGNGQGQRYSQGYGEVSGYPVQVGRGCSTGGCSTGYSGYQPLPAQPSFGLTGMARDIIQAVTLPAPIMFDENVQEDGSGAEE